MIKPTANTGLQNGGLCAFLEIFVLAEGSGIFSNFGAEKPPLQQAANR